MRNETTESNGPLLLGSSRVMEAVRTQIAIAARTDAKVLVLGETGVGKDVVARLIHAQSTRQTRPFVAVNCSGVPETLLESELFGHIKGSFTGAHRDHRGLVRRAEGGTLFLDELGEMSLRMQAVLLRFAESGEIQPVGADAPVARTNVRLITATNRDLRARIAAGTFREDLYYRLNVIEINVPPLRDRGNDVLLLLEHYLERASRTHSLPCPQLTEASMQRLCAYRWPGNVRELRNVAERLVAQCFDRSVTPDDLPSAIGIGDAPGRSNSKPTVLAVPRLSPVGMTDGNAMDRVEQLWDRLQAGEDFWTAVYPAFTARELCREDLAALIHRGLQHTHGSYRALVTLFHLPPTDYKRFHAFLYHHACNLPVAPYRSARVDRTSPLSPKDTRYLTAQSA
jgi:DNA-binding NtrC family response regulator